MTKIIVEFEICHFKNTKPIFKKTLGIIHFLSCIKILKFVFKISQT